MVTIMEGVEKAKSPELIPVLNLQRNSILVDHLNNKKIPEAFD